MEEPTFKASVTCSGDIVFFAELSQTSLDCVESNFIHSTISYIPEYVDVLTYTTIY
jgi:hypothetical protein